jgi:D-alanyl-D-alanine dipeptidase
MKPYQKIEIKDCGEPLVPIPLEQFPRESPHPYEKLGANYGTRSPYFLRQGVLNALIEAQTQLKQVYPSWHIKIFDAYRPLEVQQFMVDYTFATAVKQQGLSLETLSEQQCKTLWEQVYQLWAIPSHNRSTPPPHSTGAAVDITLMNEQGEVDMGSAIDELSARSHPDYYAQAITPETQQYHARRQLLNQVMINAGFRRHPGEWWHFSLGDQMWVWLHHQENPSQVLTARYGRWE